MQTREEVLATVKQRGRALQDAGKFRSDREIVLEAVKNYGGALEWAAVEFRSDREIVLEAVRRDGLALDFAPKFQEDQEIVLEAVKQNGTALGLSVITSNYADKEIVLEAVKQNGIALQHARTEWRADKDVVLAAVRQNSRALQHASDELRADQKILLAAASCIAAEGDAVPVLDVERITYRISLITPGHLEVVLRTIEGGEITARVFEEATLGELAHLAAERIGGCYRVHLVLPEGARVTPWQCDTLVADFADA